MSSSGKENKYRLFFLLDFLFIFEVDSQLSLFFQALTNENEKHKYFKITLIESSNRKRVL